MVNLYSCVSWLPCFSVARVAHRPGNRSINYGKLSAHPGESRPAVAKKRRAPHKRPRRERPKPCVAHYHISQRHRKRRLAELSRFTALVPCPAPARVSKAAPYQLQSQESKFQAFLVASKMQKAAAPRVRGPRVAPRSNVDRRRRKDIHEGNVVFLRIYNRAQAALEQNACKCNHFREPARHHKKYLAEKMKDLRGEIGMAIRKIALRDAFGVPFVPRSLRRKESEIVWSWELCHKGHIDTLVGLDVLVGGRKQPSPPPFVLKTDFMKRGGFDPLTATVSQLAAPWQPGQY